jgi:hypothetical protein
VVLSKGKTGQRRDEEIKQKEKTKYATVENKIEKLKTNNTRENT